MKFPVAVGQFAHLIPHRAPMLWVDEVIAAEGYEGECRVHLKPDALYMQDGQVRATTPIEWMAQTFAFVNCVRASFTKPLQEAFLVSVRQARVLAPIAPESSVRVRVFNARELGPIIMFDGEVLTEDGRRLAQASLRIYHN